MRHILLIGMLMMLTACGLEVTSQSVSPNDFKQAEMVCSSNGGLKGVFVTHKSRYDAKQFVQVECNNGVTASQVRGK